MSFPREKTKCLHMRMWAYFLVLAIVIMVTVWVLQIVLLKTYYSVMKSHQINSFGRELSEVFEPEEGISLEYCDYIYTFCHRHGVSARIFNGDGELIYSPDLYMFRNDKYRPEPFFKEEFSANDEDTKPRMPGRPRDPFQRMFEEISAKLEGNKKYTLETFEDGFSKLEQMLYVCKLQGVEGEVYYLTISSALAPVDVTSQVLQNQLVLITVISLIMAFLLSYFFARQLAKPIVNITNSAKKLAEGDYSVSFEGSKYTEINQLSDVLNTTTKELAKTDTLRRDLMANVSHDLRTPMTIIKSYGEMIRDISGNNPEKRAAHTQVIIDEADRLTTLVNDILDLSRLESGTAKIEPREMNLSKTVEEIINRFGVFEETAGFDFKTEVEPDLFVLGDERTVAQVIYNLISNAVNYTGDDKKVYITLQKKDENARFEVRDTGHGIPEEEMELVWKRYYRASEMHKRTKIGTGIGLSIVKNILESHGADYGVESKVGEGSVFWFEMKCI